MLKNTIALAALSLAVSGCGDVKPTSSEGNLNPQISAPSAPKSIRVIHPDSSPSRDNTPTLRITGITSGQYVHIYKTSACATAIKTAKAKSTSIDITLGALANGTYKFYARTSNAAGKSKCKGYAAYKVDRIAPSSPVVNFPVNNSFVTNPDTIIGTCESGATVHITGDITTTSGSCSGGNFNIPVNFTVGDGVKNISVTQTDAAGNASSATSLNYNYDITPPSVLIGAPSFSQMSTGMIEYAVTYTDAALVNLIANAHVNVSTTGTVTYTKSVLNGTTTNPTIQINITGGDGTIDSVSLTAGSSQDNHGLLDLGATQGADIDVDNTPATVSIGAPSTSLINTGNVDYSVTYTGASVINLVANAHVNVTTTGTVAYTKSVLNGTTANPTIRISITGGDGTIDSVSVSGGSSQDDFGNLDLGETQDANVTVDNALPTVSIGAPNFSHMSIGNVDYSVSYADASSINLLAANVTVHTTGTVTYTKSILSGTTANPTIRISITGGDGTIDSVSISAGTSGDTAGNLDTGASQGTDVIINNTPPTISIGAPSTSLINTGNVDYSVTYTGASVINLVANAHVNITTTGTVAYTKSILNGTTANPTIRISITGGDGTIDSVSIIPGSSYNSAGLLDESGGSQGTDVTVDNTAPTLSLTSPGVINIINQSSFSISGTCVGEGFAVDITAPTGINAVTTNCSAGTFSFNNLDMQSIPDGTINFTVSITDTAGNAGTGSGTSTKDTVAPSITSLALNNPATSPGNDTTPTIAISGIFPIGDTFELFSDATCTTSVSSSVAAAGANSAIVTSNALSTNTSYTYFAKGTDAAGNTSCSGAGVSVSYTLDTVAPSILITLFSGIGPTNQSNYSISGTCSTDGDSISISSPALAGSTTCTGGIFVLSSIDASSLSDGDVDITLEIADVAGNTGSDTALTVKDVTAPTAPSCDALGFDATPNKSDTVTWSGSTDATSGINHYEMKIIRPYTGDEIIGWTDIGSVVSPYQFTGISPQLRFNDYDNGEGQVHYRISIHAVDNYGNISSDADCADFHLRPAYGNFKGTESTAPSDAHVLNQDTSYALKFSEEKFNSSYFRHSLDNEPQQIVINEDGNYLLSHVLPLTRVNGEATTQVGSAKSIVKINGIDSEVGFAANSFTLGHHVSIDGSNHMTVLLENLHEGDVITIESMNNTNVNEPMQVAHHQMFTAFLQYIPAEEKIFSATSTTTRDGDIDLNYDTESTYIWTNSITNAAFTHDQDSADIRFEESGTYLISINIPQQGTDGYTYQKIGAHIQIDGNDINMDSYTNASNGMISNLDGHRQASTNYVNALLEVNAGQTLNIHSFRLGEKDMVTVAPGFKASIYIQKLNVEHNTLVSLGQNLTDWNTPQTVPWIKDFIIDNDVFQNNSEQIVVNYDGDYMVYISDRIQINENFVAPITKLKINDTEYPGAECAAHNANTNFNLSRNTNCDMQILLQDLKKGDGISFTTENGIIGGETSGYNPKITIRKVSENP